MTKPKSLPLTYFYLCILLTIIIFFIFPNFNIIKFPNNLFGLAIMAFGLLIIFWTWKLFINAGTKEDFSESKTVVVGGPYKYSRNPMYAGMIIFLIGLVILFENILGFISPVLFFLIMEFMFIPFEEKKMEKELGKKYLDYKKKVRKWL